MQRTLRKTHETAGVALSAAPAPVELQPDSGDDAAARMPRTSTRAKVQHVADPFDRKRSDEAPGA